MLFKKNFLVSFSFFSDFAAFILVSIHRAVVRSTVTTVVSSLSHTFPDKRVAVLMTHERGTFGIHCFSHGEAEGLP